MQTDIPFDFGTIPESHQRALLRELRTGEMMDRVKAEASQKIIARDNQREHRAVNGLGQCVATFDAEGYFLNAAKNGQDGRDPDYIRWAVKHHPECRVNSVGTKTQVGYGSKERPSCSRVKIHKAYR